jgi:TonB-linked SusC/RagA family outer membrane protein
MLFTTANAMAQQTITGTVTDAQTGDPLAGVNILVVGTSTGAATDADGHYSVTVPSLQDTLRFSFIGYKTKTVAISEHTTLNINLIPTIISGQQLVVIGYGTSKKSNLTGSITHLNANKLEKSVAATQLTGLLSGRVAGLMANQSSGAAGGSSLLIRGQNSISASTTPLIVVDGGIFKGNIANINPSDIESIDVLEGPSATAIYGDRAASGVIIVTTKKGKKGKPTINFSSRIGMGLPTNKLNAYGPKKYIQYRADYLRTIFPDLPYYYFSNPNNLPKDVSSQDWHNLSNAPLKNNIDEYLRRLRFRPTEQENFKNGKTTDWYDYVMRKAFHRKYDINISGGTDKSTYYWSVGYLANRGLKVGDQFSALHSTLNIDHQITNYLDIGLHGRYTNRNGGGVPVSSTSFFLNSPYGTVFLDNGFLKRKPNDHTNSPLLNHFLTTHNLRWNIFGANFFANVTLPAGLEYKFSYQPYYNFKRDFEYTSNSARLGGRPDIDQTSAHRYLSTWFEWTLRNTLKWKKQIGINNFKVTLLYAIEKDREWSSQLNNQNFKPNGNLEFNGIQFGDTPQVSSNDTKATGISAMARLNYSLLDKYLLTATIRRDGYSAFGTKNPISLFPSFAVAWKISNEKFFKSNIINNLKIRAEYGANGNRSIGQYSALGRVSSLVWYNGSSNVIGTKSSNLANLALRWEETKSFDVGFDISFLKNRLGLTMDAYTATTEDLLLNRRIPILTGFNNIETNLGELGNRGINLTINSQNISTKNINWTSKLTFSFNRNKVKKLYGNKGTYVLLGKTHKGELPDYQNEWFPGYPLDIVWNYKRLGIWQVDEKAKAAKYGLRPGDFKVEDVNGDGKYTAKQDKQFIGYTKPRYHLGLSNSISFMGNWTASMFIRAELGYIGSVAHALNKSNVSDDRQNRGTVLPYWTPENPINTYPRLEPRLGPFGGGIGYYTSRSYVRIQNISLSYTLSQTLAEKFHLQSMRIFLADKNVVTFTKWPLWDPETGNSPLAKIFTVGVHISL